MSTLVLFTGEIWHLTKSNRRPQKYSRLSCTVWWCCLTMSLYFSLSVCLFDSVIRGHDGVRSGKCGSGWYREKDIHCLWLLFGPALQTGDKKLRKVSSAMVFHSLYNQRVTKHLSKGGYKGNRHWNDTHRIKRYTQWTVQMQRQGRNYLTFKQLQQDGPCDI